MPETYFNLIVAGSRYFNDYYTLEKEIDCFIEELSPVGKLRIFSGGARGADRMGELYARENFVPLKIFKADWDTHGRSAGPIRNRKMVENADAAIFFWDGSSRGTADCISCVQKKKLPIKLVEID
ncbi:MAG: DUF2493 domain-containing protein [Elusimicrobia bacterium]|nr:DUF2493 domain-containing protein [Elusimicrobiota bacterium]